MAEAIAWGEEDIRDAMEGFDPGAVHWTENCVRGERNKVSVYAYWAPQLFAGVYDMRPRQKRRYKRFLDPIEAIQCAIALANGGTLACP